MWVFTWPSMSSCVIVENHLTNVIIEFFAGEKKEKTCTSLFSRHLWYSVQKVQKVNILTRNKIKIQNLFRANAIYIYMWTTLFPVDKLGIYELSICSCILCHPRITYKANTYINCKYICLYLYMYIIHIYI